MTNLIIALNCDTSDSPYGSSLVEWVDLSLGNDTLIMTAGSDVVADGEPIPSGFQLSQAGFVLEGIQIICDLYLLADLSANQLKEVHNMGNQNKQYVMAFVFDGATTSEPVLEAWDDVDMDSVALTTLGEGTPANSFLKGITTTDALPGTNWVGSTLAGASDGHFLWLNNENGALSGADTLYCNLKLVIPASQTEAGAEFPVIVCKYTTT